MLTSSTFNDLSLNPLNITPSQYAHPQVHIKILLHRLVSHATLLNSLLLHLKILWLFWALVLAAAPMDGGL